MKKMILKKYRLCPFLLAFLLITINLKSQSDERKLEAERLIEGEWAFNYEGSKQKSEKKHIESFEELPEALKKNIIASYKERVMIFKADHSFVQNNWDGSKWKANWTVSDNGKTLSIISNDGLEQEFKIISVNKTSITISPTDKMKGDVHFTQWHLIKN
jgi:hypothetical protein